MAAPRRPPARRRLGSGARHGILRSDVPRDVGGGALVFSCGATSLDSILSIIKQTFCKWHCTFVPTIYACS